MMKKTVIIGGAVVVLLAGGGYIYQVQQFDREAHDLVAALDKMKPMVTFDKIEVNKYAFNVKFTGFQMSTKGLKEYPLFKDIPADIPEMSFGADVVTNLCYNPLTKTATFKTPNHSSSKIKFGEKVKTLKSDSKGEATVAVSFKHQPNLVDFHLKHFLANITNIAINNPPVTVVDGDTGIMLLSHEGMQYNVSLKVPENNQENVVIKYTDNMKNFKLEKELFNLPLGFIDAPEIRQHMQKAMDQAALQYGGAKSGKGEVDFKMKKADLESLIHHVKTNIGNPAQMAMLPHGFPSVEFSYKLDSQDKMGQFKGNLFEITYEQPHKDLVIKSDWTMKLSPEVRKVLVQIFAAEFANLPQPIKISEDMLPDFAALGDIKFAFTTHAHLEKMKGDIDLSLATDLYKAHFKAHYDGPAGGVMKVDIENHDKFFADFKAYLDRLLANKEIQALGAAPMLWDHPQDGGQPPAVPYPTPNIVQQLMALSQGLDMAKMTLETMGKVEQKGDKTILKIEQALPAGMPAMMMPPMGQLPVGQ